MDRQMGQSISKMVVLVGHRCPRLTDAQWEERTNCRKAAAVHRNLLHVGLCSYRLIWMPLLTPANYWKHLQWACNHQNCTTEQWKKVALSFIWWKWMPPGFTIRAQSMEASPCNLEVSKNILLTLWCQIKDDIFKSFGTTDQSCFGDRGANCTTLGTWFECC